MYMFQILLNQVRLKTNDAEKCFENNGNRNWNVPFYHWLKIVL